MLLLYISHRNGLSLIVRACLDRYSWSLTIALRISVTKISRLGAKIINLVHELDEPEGYVTRDLCIFTEEVGWNPDRTVMNENIIYNGTRCFDIQILCTYRYYLGVQKSQQTSSEKKVVLSKIVPEEILK